MHIQVQRLPNGLIYNSALLLSLDRDPSGHLQEPPGPPGPNPPKSLKGPSGPGCPKVLNTGIKTAKVIENPLLTLFGDMSTLFKTFCDFLDNPGQSVQGDFFEIA